jgi:hypothetical protein
MDPQAQPIWILEEEPNRRGDLFTSLMREVFHALGYDPDRTNVPKSGREVDLQGQHRHELNRHMVAECKATTEPTGGSDINHFIGVLDTERRQLVRQFGNDTLVNGYFVSLSGFKSSAIEQEAICDNSRVVLLDGAQVVAELIRGRIIVSREAAIDRASRGIPADSQLKIESTQLLAHSVGFAWAIYYTHNKRRTHFALVHADGEPLARHLADQIVASAEGHLSGLTYLSPEGWSTSNEAMAKARE